jgi:hypothetical protein
MATEAEKLASNPDSIETGWAPTALDGLRLTLDLADQKRIKIIVNGGGLNPRGLAEKTHKMVCILRFIALGNTSSRRCTNSV